MARMSMFKCSTSVAPSQGLFRRCLPLLTALFTTSTDTKRMRATTLRGTRPPRSSFRINRSLCRVYSRITAVPVPARERSGAQRTRASFE